jgi:tyrosine-protein kinase Etk/Wzc
MKNKHDVVAVNLKAATKDLVKYWYFIILFLVITMFFGIMFVKYSSKTYRAESGVLIRIDNNNRIGGRQNDLLRGFDFVMPDKSFQNELFFLQSFPLIREVVSEMNLRVSYYSQQSNIPKRFSFTVENIYNNSPFIVVPADDHVMPTNVIFYIDILDEEKFHISAKGDGVRLIDPRNERSIRSDVSFQMGGIYNFGSIVQHDYASFRVLLNPSYNPSNFVNKDLFFEFNNYNYLAARFKGSLRIDANSIESTMVKLSLKSENPNLGTDFLGALINKYIERRMDDANSLANKTIEHIDRQLVDVSEDLSESERQLQDIKSFHNIMNVNEKAQNLHGQLQNYELQRNEAQRRLSHLQQLSDYFMGQGDATRVLAPSSLGLIDPLLTNLIQELTNLNSERQRMLDMDQIRSPRFLTLEKSIDNLKSVISENINFSTNATTREISELNTNINRLSSEFASLPFTQRRMMGIERKFNLNDAVYTSLLEKRIQAQIVKAAKLADAEVIEPPRNFGVASPNSFIILALSFLLGLGVPAGTIILKKVITNRIDSKDDVKFITSIPVIATIPNNNKSQQNVVMNYPRSPIAEAFHMLRSNLVYYLHGENSKILLVTSSIPGEGKSFTAMNLATSFALANSRTVLVEFDLRNPSKFIEFTDVKDPVGLSSYLINRARLEDIIIPTKGFSLDIIQAGKIPPNPIELISSPRTEQLFSELKSKYDFIVVDAPPYGLVTDSFLLMSHTDLNLFVARAGYTKKTVLSASTEEIESKNIQNLYLVLNDDREDKLGYGKYTYEEKKQKDKAPYMRRKVAAM